MQANGSPSERLTEKMFFSRRTAALAGESRTISPAKRLHSRHARTRRVEFADRVYYNSFELVPPWAGIRPRPRGADHRAYCGRDIAVPEMPMSVVQDPQLLPSATSYRPPPRSRATRWSRPQLSRVR